MSNSKNLKRKPIKFPSPCQRGCTLLQNLSKGLDWHELPSGAQVALFGLLFLICLLSYYLKGIRSICCWNCKRAQHIFNKAQSDRVFICLCARSFFLVVFWPEHIFAWRREKIKGPPLKIRSPDDIKPCVAKNCVGAYKFRKLMKSNAPARGSWATNGCERIPTDTDGFRRILKRIPPESAALPDEFRRIWHQLVD